MANQNNDIEKRVIEVAEDINKSIMARKSVDYELKYTDKKMTIKVKNRELIKNGKILKCIVVKSGNIIIKNTVLNKVSKYGINYAHQLASYRLQLLENDVCFNRKIVRYWLDSLNVDKYIKLYKNMEGHLEVAYLVIDYFGDEDNSDYPQFIYQKLGIKLSDKKRMFEEFGWNNIRKASKLVIFINNFIFLECRRTLILPKKL